MVTHAGHYAGRHAAVPSGLPHPHARAVRSLAEPVRLGMRNASAISMVLQGRPQNRTAQLVCTRKSAKVRWRRLKYVCKVWAASEHIALKESGR